jgi:biopolymer transport protein ExbB
MAEGDNEMRLSLNGPLARGGMWTCALLALVAVSGNYLARLDAQDGAAPGAAAPASRPANAAAPVPAIGDSAAPPATGITSIGREVFRVPRNSNDWIGLGFYAALLAISMVAATVSFERIFNLRRGKVVPPEFVRQLGELVRSGRDSQENLRSLATSSPAPIAKVLKDALVRAGRPLAEVEKGMEDSLGREISGLRARHRVLSVIANVATLVGLFGTVVGMIFAFQITSVTEGEKATVLAGGIYLALLTTAIGLAIAIPSMLLYHWFNTKIDTFMREMDEVLLQTMPAFARIEQSRVAGAAALVQGADAPRSADGSRRSEDRVVLTAK